MIIWCLSVPTLAASSSVAPAASQTTVFGSGVDRRASYKSEKFDYRYMPEGNLEIQSQRSHQSAVLGWPGVVRMVSYFALTHSL